MTNIQKRSLRRLIREFLNEEFNTPSAKAQGMWACEETDPDENEEDSDEESSQK